VTLTLLCAGLAVLLGVAAYGPCVDRVYIAPLGWILELFVGGVESPESPGAVCSATWSPGFQLARVFGLIATFIGAVAAAALLGRQQMTRATVRRSRDVDVVVGLGPAQLELIRALVRDNAHRPWRESWIDGRPGWRKKGGTHGFVEWLTGMRRADWRALRVRKTRTVVITSDPNNSWAAEARQVGASVLTADPSDPAIIDLVILRNGWRRSAIAVRRFFAITEDAQYNEAIGRMVQNRLTLGRESNCLGHFHDAIPQLFVRFGDHRTAKAWTVNQLGYGGSVACQGITELASTVVSIVGTLLKPTLADAWRVESVTLVGTGRGGLVPALLDEIAWQSWRRYEISIDPMREPGKPMGTPIGPNLKDIRLVGQQASLLADQWKQFRAPWLDATVPRKDWLQMPRISAPAAESDLTAIEADLIREQASQPMAFVFLEADAGEVARRVAQRRPQDFVFCYDPTINGVQSPLAPGLPYLFGPQYVRPGDRPQTDQPPTDLIHLMAEQQHAVFRGRWPAPDEVAERWEAKATAHDWPMLGDFFRADNVRQVAMLIDWFERNRYRWTQITADSAPLSVSSKDLDDLAVAEFQRWKALRERRSWVHGEIRNDAWRTHQDLGEHPDDLGYNGRIEKAIIHRLWAYGLAPEPLTMVERVGTVTAQELESVRTWRTTNGDLLIGERGDWLVTGPSGDVHTVAKKAFRDTYRHIDGDRYERVGTMWARLASQREVVQTWEGPAVAEPGMWIMTGPHGNHWPVPQEAFAAGYRIVDEGR
jgi:hypothetical protein